MSMNLEELCALLEMPPAAVEKLKNCQSALRMEEVEPYLAGMMEGETAAASYEALKAFLGNDEDGFRLLFCQLECARRCHARYRTRRIPDRVFAETMKCFPRFLRETERRTGKLCYDRGWWTYRQISMRLFRIGELEYELCRTGAEPVVSVHIPSDAAFGAKDVDESLKQAEQFLERYFSEYRHAKRMCSSWLLSPELAKLLPAHSNIRDFQRRFEIVEVYPEDREFMEWIFDASRNADFSHLPERTSLQRAVKELLRAGGSIGAACGIMK